MLTAQGDRVVVRTSRLSSSVVEGLERQAQMAGIDVGDADEFARYLGDLVVHALPGAMAAAVAKMLRGGELVDARTQEGGPEQLPQAAPNDVVATTTPASRAGYQATAFAEPGDGDA